MKYLIILICTVLYLLISSTALGAIASGDCAARRAALEASLETARQEGSAHQVAGIETVLAKVTLWCAHESQKTEANTAIQKVKKEIAERQLELADVMGSGDENIIVKHEHALAEAQQNLATVLAERNALD